MRPPLPPFGTFPSPHAHAHADTYYLSRIIQNGQINSPLKPSAWAVESVAFQLDFDQLVEMVIKWTKKSKWQKYVHISYTLFADWQINTLISTVHNLEQKRGKIVFWIICSLSQKWDLEKWPEDRYRIRTGVYTLPILFIIFTPLNINVLECLLCTKVNKKAYQSNKLKQKFIFSLIFTYI